MAIDGEFYTFYEVVHQLKINEGKLKRLVAEGEISAFREGDVMMFKKTEIDKLGIGRGGRGSSTETAISETVLDDQAPAFEDEGDGVLTGDLVFDPSDDESPDFTHGLAGRTD